MEKDLEEVPATQLSNSKLLSAYVRGISGNRAEDEDPESHGDGLVDTNRFEREIMRRMRGFKRPARKSVAEKKRHRDPQAERRISSEGNVSD
jgi:hypothetical protein